jgi:hypothetical protein
MEAIESGNRGTAAVVAEIMQRLAAPSAPVELPNGDTVIFYGNELQTHTVPNLNPILPEDVKASEIFVEPASLAQYAIMYRTPTAILKASLNAATVVALLDYHEPVYHADGSEFDSDKDGGKPIPQRNQHQATYKAEYHPDFIAWREKVGQQMGQVDFAEFIEDRLHTIAEPAAADLIDALTELKIHRAASFENKVDLRGGKIGLSFKEEDSQGGKMQLPDKIVVVVPIFQGTGAVPLTFKLRYRLIERSLKLYVVCPGLQTIVRNEFTSIAEGIQGKTDLPLFYVA